MADQNEANGETLTRLLEAALIHVPFDGWSEPTFKAALSDSGIEPALGRAICPRGAVDLAVAYHDRGDDLMAERLAQEDLSEMKFRDRITRAVQLRLEVVEDKEAVRRGVTLFALPQYAPDGARALWGTVDRIWNELGDSSRDVNWYTKRATLSGVYSSTVLYWLGDDSPDDQRTWRFLERRIEDVMNFESIKKKVNENRLLKPFLAAPNWALGLIKAPGASPREDLPGRVRDEV